MQLEHILPAIDRSSNVMVEAHLHCVTRHCHSDGKAWQVHCALLLIGIPTSLITVFSFALFSDGCYSPDGSLSISSFHSLLSLTTVLSGFKCQFRLPTETRGLVHHIVMEKSILGDGVAPKPLDYLNQEYTSLNPNDYPLVHSAERNHVVDDE